MEVGLLWGSPLGFHVRAACQTEPTNSRNVRGYCCTGAPIPLCFPGDNCYSNATPCHLQGASYTPAEPVLQVLLQQSPGQSPAGRLHGQRCCWSSDGEKVMDFTARGFKKRMSCAPSTLEAETNSCLIPPGTATPFVKRVENID